MNSLWRPWIMDRDEISNLYRGPSIDASYQVSVHLAERFAFHPTCPTMSICRSMNLFIKLRIHIIYICISWLGLWTSRL
jgi:hypothetical protein